MKLQDLLQERGQLATQMHDMHKAAEKEDRGFTADESEKWDNLDSKLDELDKRIKANKRASSIIGYTDDQIKDMKPEGLKEEEQREITQGQAFSALLRSTQPGQMGLSADQQAALQRAQAKGTDSAGGYLAPEEFRNNVIDRMSAFGGVRNVATVISTETGNSIPMPTNDDTGNTGAIIGENTQDSEQDMTFGEVNLGAFKYTSRIIRVPIELLQDSAFDLDTYIQGKFGERLGRATSAHYATGTGTGQPQGLAAATVGNTAAANTGIAYDDLLNLKHSVDPAYRGNARWGFNDNTFLALKKLKDSDNRPLWLPDIAGVAPSTIDGDAFFIDQGFADIGASAVPVVYGDMSGYWVRDVMGMTVTRMVERYADFHQVGFVAILRSDGRIIDGNGIRAMDMPV